MGATAVWPADAMSDQFVVLCVAGDAPLAPSHIVLLMSFALGPYPRALPFVPVVLRASDACCVVQLIGPRMENAASGLQAACTSVVRRPSRRA